MRNDPSDSGGLFIGRRTGTAPVQHRESPNAGNGAGSRAETLRECLRAFLGFPERDRDASRVLFDQTLPAGGEIAKRERLIRIVADSPAGPLAPGHRARAAVETAGLATGLLGACEVPPRWCLHTGAITSQASGELLSATIDPAPRALGERSWSVPSGAAS